VNKSFKDLARRLDATTRIRKKARPIASRTLISQRSQAAFWVEQGFSTTRRADMWLCNVPFVVQVALLCRRPHSIVSEQLCACPTSPLFCLLTPPPPSEIGGSAFLTSSHERACTYNIRLPHRPITCGSANITLGGILGPCPTAAVLGIQIYLALVWFEHNMMKKGFLRHNTDSLSPSTTYPLPSTRPPLQGLSW